MSASSRDLVAAERVDGDLATAVRRQAGDRGIEQHPQTGAVRRILAPVGTDQQQERRVRGLEQLAEQGRTVDVAPLQVVDGEDQRLAVADPREELAQGTESPAAKLLRVLDVGRALGRFGHGVNPAQHGEHPRQRRHVAGHQALGFVPMQPAQEACERVDQRVDRLVGDRLLLVASAAQHDRLAALDQSIEESLEERALAGPRPAMDEDGAGLAAPDGRERFGELGELLLAADEEPRSRAGSGRGRRRGAAARTAEPLQDLLAGRTIPRVSLQQVHAEVIQLVRHRRVDRPGLRRVGELLLHHHVERLARRMAASP